MIVTEAASPNQRLHLTGAATRVCATPLSQRPRQASLAVVVPGPSYFTTLDGVSHWPPKTNSASGCRPRGARSRSRYFSGSVSGWAA